MIELAKANVPKAEFVRANVLDMYFGEDAFDAIVSFYALFHVPRKKQPDLFYRFYEWIKPGGYFLATYARGGYKVPGYTEDDFFGTKMYWSNFSFDRFRALLQETGFEELRVGIVGDDREDPGDMEEIAPYVFARSTKRDAII